MASCRTITHLLFTLLAVFAFALNGARAHVVMVDGETQTFEICNAHGVQSVILSVGEPVPASSESDTCCGDCVGAAALVCDVPVLQPLKGLAGPVPALSVTHQVHPRSPLWPGAPPHGPPAAL